jgi:hypothetical protein
VVLHGNFMRKIYNMLAMITKALWSKMEIEQIAQYAFMAVVVIAIIAGLAYGYNEWDHMENAVDLWDTGWIMLIMVILGIIVGLVSITAKESTPFLIASIALIVTGTMMEPFNAINTVAAPLGYMATWIVTFIAAFAAPAAVLIAIKAVYAMAKEK